MAKSRGRKFAEITSPSSGVFDLTSVPTITNAKLQNSAMTLAGSSVSLGGTGVANTDALSEGSSNLYFTNARVQSFLGGGTLAGNIVVPDNISIYLGSSSDFRLVHNTTNTQLINATGALQITSNGGFDVTGAATFSSTIVATGAITANAGVVVDNITIDGTEIDLSSGDLTLDSAGDIVLDADGGDVYLKDGGTTFLQIKHHTSTDIYSLVSDNDLKLIVRDGSSNVEALVFDAANGGKATFANDIAVVDNRGLRLGSDNDSVIYNDGSNLYIKNNTSNQDIIFQGNDDGSTGFQMLKLDASNAGTALFGGQILTPAAGVIETVSSAGTLTISGGSTNKGGKIELSGGNNTGTGGSGIKFYAQASTATPAERMRIDSSGNVNIGAKAYITNQNTSTDNLQVGYALNLYEDSYSSGTDNYAVWANNLYYGAGTGNLYMRNDEASRIYQHAGNFYFQNAAAGTAGNAVTLSSRFFIGATGNVGIGTNSPAFKLQFGGNTDNLGAVTTNKQIMINLDGGYSTSASRQYKVIGFSGTTNGGTDDIKGSTYTSGEQLKNFYIGLMSDQAYFNSSRFSIIQGATERFVINQSGYVGINNNTPDRRLYVDENAVNWIATFRNVHASSYGVSIDLSQSTASNLYALAVYTASNAGMFVNNHGDVNIGNSTAPGLPLMVNANNTGKIAAFVNRSSGTQGITIGTTTGAGQGYGLHVGHQGTFGFLHPYNYGSSAFTQMQIQATDTIIKNASGTEHLNVRPGGQILGGVAGRNFGLSDSNWNTFGRLKNAQGGPIRIVLTCGHNSYGSSAEILNDTYAYGVSAGTVVNIGSSSPTNTYHVSLRKVKRVGGDYASGDGGWEYQIQRQNNYGFTVFMTVMGTGSDWTWTV